MNEIIHSDYVEIPLKEKDSSPKELQLALEMAWKEVEKIRKARMRRYAIAAGFTATGIFLLFLSLMMLLERLAIWPFGIEYTYIALTFLGALSFGYGFYRMGAH